MRTGEICSLHTIHCQRDTSVQAAAADLPAHAGDLIVAEQPNSRTAERRAPARRHPHRPQHRQPWTWTWTLPACWWSAQLFTAGEDKDACGIIEHMRVNGIRRLPVVNTLVGLSGILSIDDLLAVLAQQMAGLARIGSGQQVHEKHLRK